jgi:hypothetical protein
MSRTGRPMGRPPLRRKCVASGLQPDIGARVDVTSFRLVRYYRDAGARRTAISIGVGLCRRCLGDLNGKSAGAG